MKGSGGGGGPSLAALAVGCPGLLPSSSPFLFPSGGARRGTSYLKLGLNSCASLMPIANQPNNYRLKGRGFRRGRGKVLVSVLFSLFCASLWPL